MWLLHEDVPDGGAAILPNALEILRDFFPILTGQFFGLFRRWKQG